MLIYSQPNLYFTTKKTKLSFPVRRYHIDNHLYVRKRSKLSLDLQEKKKRQNMANSVHEHYMWVWFPNRRSTSLSAVSSVVLASFLSLFFFFQIYCDLCLFSLVTGRAPNTKRLNLSAVGVETDEIGGIKVVIFYMLHPFHVCWFNPTNNDLFRFFDGTKINWFSVFCRLMSIPGQVFLAYGLLVMLPTE